MYVLGWYKFKCFVYPNSLAYVSHSTDITIKMLKICTLFQPIKLQIFCLLTIISYSNSPNLVFEIDVIDVVLVLCSGVSTVDFEKVKF